LFLRHINDTGFECLCRRSHKRKGALTSVGNQQTETEKEANHLDPQKCIVAIIQKVLGLAAIDPNNTQEELSAEAESHELHLLSNDSI
jgi:hypothetical protein